MKRLNERYVGQSENGGDQIENHENFVAVYAIGYNTAQWREQNIRQGGQRRYEVKSADGAVLIEQV